MYTQRHNDEHVQDDEIYETNIYITIRREERAGMRGIDDDIMLVAMMKWLWNVCLRGRERWKEVGTR